MPLIDIIIRTIIFTVIQIGECTSFDFKQDKGEACNFRCFTFMIPLRFKTLQREHRCSSYIFPFSTDRPSKHNLSCSPPYFSSFSLWPRSLLGPSVSKKRSFQVEFSPRHPLPLDMLLILEWQFNSMDRPSSMGRSP